MAFLILIKGLLSSGFGVDLEFLFFVFLALLCTHWVGTCNVNLNKLTEGKSSVRSHISHLHICPQTKLHRDAQEALLDHIGWPVRSCWGRGGSPKIQQTSPCCTSPLCIIHHYSAVFSTGGICFRRGLWQVGRGFKKLSFHELLLSSLILRYVSWGSPAESMSRSAFLPVSAGTCAFLVGVDLASVIPDLIISRLDYCKKLYVGLPSKMSQVGSHENEVLLCGDSTLRKFPPTKPAPCYYAEGF